MTLELFPTSQAELLRAARGQETQTAFAKTLGVGRTSLCRYESEEIGAPTEVLNYCLRAVAKQLQAGQGSPVRRALALVRKAADTLEHVDMSL